MPRGVAFFDVDETLITVKSMFRFLKYHLRERGLPPEAYEEAALSLRRRAAAGVSRTQTNREYYRLFAGRSVHTLHAHGRAWFAAELATREILHRPVVHELKRLQERGDLIVLVSGSFHPCLTPIGELLDVDEILCTEPERVGGYYTGQVEQPVIGPEKGRLARELLERLSVPRERSAAYGDHASDLELLRSVGNPVAVGDDMILSSYVDRVGGRTLPGIRRTTSA